MLRHPVVITSIAEDFKKIGLIKEEEAPSNKESLSEAYAGKHKHGGEVGAGTKSKSSSPGHGGLPKSSGGEAGSGKQGHAKNKMGGTTPQVAPGEAGSRKKSHTMNKDPNHDYGKAEGEEYEDEETVEEDDAFEEAVRFAEQFARDWDAREEGEVLNLTLSDAQMAALEALGTSSTLSEEDDEEDDDDDDDESDDDESMHMKGKKEKKEGKGGMPPFLKKKMKDKADSSSDDESDDDDDSKDEDVDVLSLLNDDFLEDIKLDDDGLAEKYGDDAAARKEELEAIVSAMAERSRMRRVPQSRKKKRTTPMTGTERAKERSRKKKNKARDKRLKALRARTPGGKKTARVAMAVGEMVDAEFFEDLDLNETQLAEKYGENFETRKAQMQEMMLALEGREESKDDSLERTLEHIESLSTDLFEGDDELEAQPTFANIALVSEMLVNVFRTVLDEGEGDDSTAKLVEGFTALAYAAAEVVEFLHENEEEINEAALQEMLDDQMSTLASGLKVYEAIRAQLETQGKEGSGSHEEPEGKGADAA